MKLTLRLYIILIFIALLLAGLVAYFSRPKSQTQEQSNYKNTANFTAATPAQISPTLPPYNSPTFKLSNSPNLPSTSVTPTPISPTFTGVKDETFPQTTISASEQKRTLRQKTPLTQPSFAIEFNFEEDQFIVNLKEPKLQSKKSFETWLSQNYPSITIENFNFK